MQPENTTPKTAKDLAHSAEERILARLSRLEDMQQIDRKHNRLAVLFGALAIGTAALAAKLMTTDEPGLGGEVGAFTVMSLVAAGVNEGVRNDKIKKLGPRR